MSTPLHHARHNRKACDHLHSQKDFPDWVVTTCFYSAMHYAHAAIFPFEDGGQMFTNIEQYYNARKKGNETKHSVTINLIRNKKFAICEKYKELKDTANTSRYHDYEIHPKVVEKMRLNLSKIEAECEKVCEEKKSKTAESIKPDSTSS